MAGAVASDVWRCHARYAGIGAGSAMADLDRGKGALGTAFSPPLRC